MQDAGSVASLVVSEVEDVINGRRVERLRGLLTEGHLYHDPLADRLVVGPEPVIERVERLIAAFPDGYLTVEEVIGADERLLIRWTWAGTHTGPLMGHPASGRRALVSGLHLLRLAGARAVETWPGFDTVGLLRQLGLSPPPTGGPR